jgi:hypothetical protein
MGDGNHARAVRIADEKLGRLLADHAAAVDDETWLAAEYWRAHDPSRHWRQLVLLWFEWTAICCGPRWTNPGVAVTREGIEFTENTDGTGARKRFTVESRGDTYWLIEQVDDERS